MIRSTLRGMTGLSLLFAALTAGFLLGRITAPEPDPAILIRDALDEIAEFALLESRVPLTLTHRVDGYLGGVVVRLDTLGIRRIGYDLSRARILGVDPATRTVTLDLPPTEVLHAGLAPEASRFALYRTGLWSLSLAPPSEERLLADALAEAHGRLNARGIPQDEPEWNRRREAVTAVLHREIGWHVRFATNR
jgi:hypothetical protein